jgi:hypothetical protein
MNISPWVPIGLAALYYFIVKGKNNILNQLQIGLAGIVPDIVNFRLKLKVSFFNPLPTTLTVSSMVGNVTIQDQKIAEFFNSSGFVLQPGANIIEISAFPLIGNIISSASNILKGKIQLNYTVSSGVLTYSDSVYFFA